MTLQGELLLTGLFAGAVLAAYFVGRRPQTRERDDAPLREPTMPQADSRLEQLVREVGVGIVILDARGRITSLNPLAAAIFEVGAKSVAGKSLIEIVQSFELDRRVREALAGRLSRGAVRVASRHGTRMLSVKALPAEGGEGAILIANDETRLHELEQTRRDFVSSVSHELRTPLSSINLMIETILTTDLDEEALRLFLPRVKQEVDRMVQLVEDLLDLARSEGGRLRMRVEELDLTSVAGNILRTLEPRARQLGVSMRFQGGPAHVLGDADRLAQVVVNLVDNALRHTPSGGTVSVSIEETAGATTLTVADTGVGIPFTDLPHIFDRFYVVDRSRARESAGTGLGLSIVKQIVEAHGGTVTVDSELGIGATFRCVFPAERPATAELGAPSPKA